MYLVFYFVMECHLIGCEWLSGRLVRFHAALRGLATRYFHIPDTIFILGIYIPARNDAASTLHGNISAMGSYLRDPLQEGSADAVPCLPVPRA
jgi:hypothetical protein